MAHYGTTEYKEMERDNTWYFGGEIPGVLFMIQAGVDVQQRWTCVHGRGLEAMNRYFSGQPVRELPKTVVTCLPKWGNVKHKSSDPAGKRNGNKWEKKGNCIFLCAENAYKMRHFKGRTKIDSKNR